MSDSDFIPGTEYKVAEDCPAFMVLGGPFKLVKGSTVAYNRVASEDMLEFTWWSYTIHVRVHQATSKMNIAPT